MYLAAVLEYLTAEIVELSGNSRHAGEREPPIIRTHDMQAAIQGDDELDVLLRATVAALGLYWPPPEEEGHVLQLQSNN